MLYFIFIQLKQKGVSFDELLTNFNFRNSELYFYFYLAIILLPINWLLESIKWKFLVNKIQNKFSLSSSIKSVLMGVFFGFITPNRVGEFGGRLFNISKGKKIKALNLSLFGGIAQFVVTISIGFVSFTLLFFQINTILFLVLISFFIFLILYAYFNINNLIVILKSVKFLSEYFNKYVLDFNFTNYFLSKLLLITLLRYCVYVFQYVFVLYFLGVQLEIYVLFGYISIMLLIQTILPSFALIDVGIRGNVLLFLLSQYIENQIIILIAVLLVWILNLVIPAIVGYIFFLKQKTEVNYEKFDNSIDSIVE